VCIFQPDIHVIYIVNGNTIVSRVAEMEHHI